jgi:hypothetical protein
MKRVLKTSAQVVYPQAQYLSRRQEQDNRFFLTSVPQKEVTDIAAKHNEHLEGNSSQIEDRLTSQSVLQLPSLKKRKNVSRQDVQESGSKKARGSTPKKTVSTSDVKVASEAGKSAEKEIVEIADVAEVVQEKMVGKPSKRLTRASGTAAAIPEDPKKKVTKPKPRKLKLSTEEEEYEREEAIRVVEEFKAKEAAKEALLVDSWESSEKAVPDQFMDDTIPKENLVINLANQGIYKKVNFDDIPKYVINGPKHVKNIPYTVPVRNTFSKIISVLSPKTNCIEGAASASDRILEETPVVSFEPSPESMRRFSEHAITLIAETGVVSSNQMENIEQEVTEVHAEIATSDTLPLNISHEEPNVLSPKSANPVSPKSNESEKTISEKIHSPSMIETVVESEIELVSNMHLLVLLSPPFLSKKRPNYRS